MINGFEVETVPLTEEELELIPKFIKGLSSRRSDNPVTSDEIIQGLQRQKIQVTAPRVRKIINHIRIHGLVRNLIATSKGYYIETDPVKIQRYIKSLHQRAAAILAVANSFNNLKP